MGRSVVVGRYPVDLLYRGDWGGQSVQEKPCMGVVGSHILYGDFVCVAPGYCQVFTATGAGGYFGIVGLVGEERGKVGLALFGNPYVFLQFKLSGA